MIAFGYNGIIFDGFLEYVDFDKVGNGFQVYGLDSDYRPRHAALRGTTPSAVSQAVERGRRLMGVEPGN